jgi:hypothetical protein
MGVRAGPVGIYGGGRRRSSSGSGAAFLGFLIVLAIIVFAVMWPLSLFGHAIGLTPSWHQLMNRNHTWMHQYYSLVGLRYLGAAGILLVVLTMLAIPLLASAKQRAEERRQQAAAAADEHERRAHAAFAERLSGPPPVLEMPGRFTSKWIAPNVPGLHPGQRLVLLDELIRRGWSYADIEGRVKPYLPDYSSTAYPTRERHVAPQSHSGAGQP